MTRRTTTVIVMSVLCFIVGVLVYIPRQTDQGTSDQWRFAPAPASTGNTWRTDFIRLYQHEYGKVDPAQGQVLIGHAAGVCAFLGADPDLPDAWQWATHNAGLSSDQATVVIAAAIRTKCPQHLHLLEGE